MTTYDRLFRSAVAGCHLLHLRLRTPGELSVEDFPPPGTRPVDLEAPGLYVEVQVWPTRARRPAASPSPPVMVAFLDTGMWQSQVRRSAVDTLQSAVPNGFVPVTGGTTVSFITGAVSLGGASAVRVELPGAGLQIRDDAEWDAKWGPEQLILGLGFLDHAALALAGSRAPDMRGESGQFWLLYSTHPPAKPRDG